MSAATLFLFPVPLSDNTINRVLPQYNIDIITGIKYFIVENIRSARRFLKQCDRTIDIDSLTFFTLNAHTNTNELNDMLAPMEQGHDVGVISEAGCPAIADPGADIVAIAQYRGYNINPLIGPSSILLSLMASGFNGQSFAFNGYLPIDQHARTMRIKELERRISKEKQTQIFIETPYRNNKLIAELCKSLPANIKLCVASDITGEQQSIITLPIAKWAKRQYNYDKVPSIFLLYQ